MLSENVDEDNCDFNFDENLFLNNINPTIIDEPNELYAQNIKVVAIENEEN